MQNAREQVRAKFNNLHLPEVEVPNPLFLLPYEIRRDLVLPKDETYNRIPALATNFRIDRQTLDRFRKHGNPYVDELERVIVDERCRIWGTAIKWATQVGLTSFFASGALDQNLLIGLYLAQATGLHKEREDRRRTQIRVYQAAMPAIAYFALGSAPDMWDKTVEQKVIFVPEVVDAIARGESMERPQITALAFGALNGMAMLISGQSDPFHIYPLAGGLAAGEIVVAAKQARELADVVKLTTGLQSFRNRVVETAKADFRIGTNLLGKLFSFAGETDLVNRNMKGENYRGLLRLAKDAGIPIAVIIKSITGLIANTLREIANQLLTVDDNRASYSSTQVGIQKLKDALDTVEKKRTSLLTKGSMAAHCEEFQQKPYATDWEAEGQIVLNKDAIAFIAPFDLRFEDENEQKLKLSQRWVVRSGLYYLNAPFGGGESVFLQGLLHKYRISETKESFIKARKGIRPYLRLHDLESQQIQNLLLYISPEPEKSTLSPVSLFVQDIKHLVPTGVKEDEELDAILSRYHFDELRPQEHLAVATCLQVAAGLVTSDEAQNALMNKDIKLLISKLLPYFTSEDYRNFTIGQLSGYKVDISGTSSILFDRTDLENISKFSSQSTLSKATRAKLRIIRTLEKAERVGSRIVAIDQTLDGLGDEGRRVFLAYLSDWSKKNGIAVIISTHNEPIKKYIKDLDAYRETIHFARDENDPRMMIVGFSNEVAKEEEKQRRRELEQEMVRRKKQMKEKEKKVRAKAAAKMKT